MTLPTQPFSLGHTSLVCVLLNLGLHLLAVALSFGLFLWQVAVGLAASPQKHCRMISLAIAYRGKTKGPEWGTNLSEVGVGLWSWARLGFCGHLPLSFSCSDCALCICTVLTLCGPSFHPTYLPGSVASPALH